MCALFLAACGQAASRAHVQPASASNAIPQLAGPALGSYAALGASETFGIGATSPARSYAHLVAKMLGAKRFVDVGIPGTTLAQGYDTELSGALAARPVLCTVFFGVNDLRAGVPLKRFLSDLYSLVVTLRRAHVRVLIIGMPDLSSLPVVRRVHIVGVAAVVHAWNAGMARVARRAGARFLDLQSFTRELAAHPNYVAPDGLHPSNAGHQRLAQVVVAAIRRDGLWRRP